MRRVHESLDKELFRKVCQKNGIKFKAESVETEPPKYVTFIGEQGRKYKVDRDFNMFETLYVAHNNLEYKKVFLSPIELSEKEQVKIEKKIKDESYSTQMSQFCHPVAKADKEYQIGKDFFYNPKPNNSDHDTRTAA